MRPGKWDKKVIEIQIDDLISVWRLDILIVNKNNNKKTKNKTKQKPPKKKNKNQKNKKIHKTKSICCIVNFAVPADVRVKLKES